MTTENFAQRLAKDAVDGLLKQAALKTAEEARMASDNEVKIDPETQKKLIEREIKMAADPDFELTELAKENAAERMRRKLGKPGETSPGTKEPAKEKAEVNVEIGRTAKAMLDMGIPAAVVAQYLIGSSTPPYPLGYGGANQGGITFTDLLTFADRMNQNKPNSELAEILKTMREEIKALRPAAPPVPPDPISQVEQTLNLVQKFKDVGLIPEATPQASGDSLEVVKERNRHEERKIELTTEKDYKMGMVDAVGNLAEDIGAGAGSQVLQRKEMPREKTGGVLETFECKDCHATIYVTPETGDKVKCAKCGMVYERPKA